VGTAIIDRVDVLLVIKNRHWSVAPGNDHGPPLFDLLDGANADAL
jgi:hypothetical protein